MLNSFIHVYQTIIVIFIDSYWNSMLYTNHIHISCMQPSIHPQIYCWIWLQLLQNNKWSIAYLRLKWFKGYKQQCKTRSVHEIQMPPPPTTKYRYNEGKHLNRHILTPVHPQRYVIALSCHGNQVSYTVHMEILSEILRLTYSPSLVTLCLSKL